MSGNSIAPILLPLITLTQRMENQPEADKFSPWLGRGEVTESPGESENANQIGFVEQLPE
jgi:hypothetical protein